MIKTKKEENKYDIDIIATDKNIRNSTFQEKLTEFYRIRKGLNEYNKLLTENLKELDMCVYVDKPIKNIEKIIKKLYCLICEMNELYKKKS